MVIVGWDSSEAFGKATNEGNSYSVSINADNVEEVTRLYNELSKGGKVKMPLEKTFWGACFGMFIDKFGIHWMVNCELKEHKDFEAKNRKDNAPARLARLHLFAVCRPPMFW